MPAFTETAPRLDNSWFDDKFGTVPMMAILRGYGAERALRTASEAWALGITLVEVPIQSDEDVETLGLLAEQAAARGFAVGAGTVTSRRHVELARAAGARFVVSPGLDLDVARYAAESGLHPLPGVGTATEVQVAERAGLRWLKAFPAAALGPQWIKLLHGPFPRTRFVATGGIDAGNAAGFLAAGARAVAVGSSLEDPEQLTRLAELRTR